ncbi:DNA replication protein DnaC [Mobilisporobacter senegalensis]|uniref:DNA replication protein DnaC n=1 Tax=Mobilisporobacter senegalensis TaxID=1329262 RepID=A0A3N1XZA2_9FIRM|nr:ATP-binding protein [Mobilisporobacter senegalensis]ROR31909.1 DNA replication protein DnaC [Mobilisporobacter senegalensis]
MALKNFQYNTILREYDSRQLKNKHDLDMRIAKIYKEIPELKEIDEKIVAGSIADTKKLLMGDESVLEKLKEDNLDLSMRKIELLCEHGYSPDYLTPDCACPDCKDTGFIGNKKCHCFKQAIVDLVYSQSNIKRAIAMENFSTFSFDHYSNDYVEETTKLTPYANIHKVVDSCKNFIKDFDKKYENILLYGNTGVGKTFLANCIAKELLDSAHTVIYLTAFQLFDILEKNKFRKNDDNYEAENQFDYILDCDLLIIDDLGTELNNTFVTSQLYLCINERHLRQKSTIISTNLSWNDLNTNYSERIFSRITSNYILLKIVGDDIRLKKAFS